MQIAAPTFKAIRRPEPPQKQVLNSLQPQQLQLKAAKPDSIQFGMQRTRTLTHSQHQTQTKTMTEKINDQLQRENANLDHFSDKVVKWGIKAAGHALIAGIGAFVHTVGGLTTGGLALPATLTIHAACHMLWGGISNVFTGKKARSLANQFALMAVPDRFKPAKDKILKHLETFGTELDQAESLGQKQKMRAKNLAQAKCMRDTLQTLQESLPQAFSSESAQKKMRLIQNWVGILENTQGAENFQALAKSDQEAITTQILKMIRDNDPKMKEAGFEIGRSLGLNMQLLNEAARASD